MTSNGLSNELKDFLLKFPETRFMDVFAPDINGILRGKRIQAEEFSKVFGEGSNYVASTPLMNVMGDIPANIVYGNDDGDPDLLGTAVPGSLAPVPWASLPTSQCLLGLNELDGSPWFLDPRNVLRNALQPLTDLGLKPVVATELEFYLVEHDGDSFKPRMPKIPGSKLPQSGHQYGSFDDLESVDSFLVDLDSFCDAQNIPAGTALSEFSPGQFEINLNHVDDPVLACDHAILLKRAVKAAARKNGLAASFMAKPFREFAGSGLHIHTSLLKEDGSNVFSGESKDGDFSNTLRHAIGGMAHAMAESMAVFAPNANSYRRYAPDFYVPATPNWGPNHRDLSMRIPMSSQKNKRVEHRVAGADACPYLVVAAVMAGIHHGIANQLEPGPMVAERQKVDYEITLPVRWSKALDAFHAGQVLPRYFGEEYHRLYEACKREESDLFNAQVSNHDYAWYLRAV
jgi:glutamine synthetase